MGIEEEKEEHPSFGMVSFSRRTGNPGRLFGSSLRTHESYVTLAVKTAVRIHSHGHDRYYGGTRGDLVEVDLSASQFAELLTTMNVGLGVPCTIRWVNEKRVPSPPEEIELEADKVRSTFKKDMGKIGAKIEVERKKVQEILSKKSLSQADRKSIVDIFNTMTMNVVSNIPFMLEQFEEAAERVVQSAKAEVDSFVTSNVIAAGLRSLTENPQVPQLPSGGLPKEEPSDVVEEVLNETSIPRLGESIYVPTSMYIDHGEDDIQGGLAEVSSVEKRTSGGKLVWFVKLKEIPNRTYNYDYLHSLQPKLKAEYGDRRAYPDPDVG